MNQVLQSFTRFAGLGLHAADGAVKGWEGGRADGKLQGRRAAAAAARRHLTAVSSSDPIQGQVAFGTVASRSEFPYVARLLYKNDDWYGCGGTLVRGAALPWPLMAVRCFRPGCFCTSCCHLQQQRLGKLTLISAQLCWRPS